MDDEYFKAETADISYLLPMKKIFELDCFHAFQISSVFVLGRKSLCRSIEITKTGLFVFSHLGTSITFELMTC